MTTAQEIREAAAERAAKAEAWTGGRGLRARPKDRRSADQRRRGDLAGPVRTRASIGLREAAPGVLGLGELTDIERNAERAGGLDIVTVGGRSGVLAGGYASTYEDPYEMYDWAGPYTEQVMKGAGATSLAAGPLVEFVTNHARGGQIPMAHTRNGTLELAEDDTGLGYTGLVDHTRTDVLDVLKALQRGDLAEASFKFMITKGSWSPDWTEYHIEGYDLDGGDVSAVNFGANPSATSGLRAAGAGPRPQGVGKAVDKMAGVRMLLALAQAEDQRHTGWRRG